MIAAIQFGIDRKYNETDPPYTVLIYNMGASATEGNREMLEFKKCVVSS